jgi:hypothetical protein
MVDGLLAESQMDTDSGIARNLFCLTIAARQTGENLRMTNRVEGKNRTLRLWSMDRGLKD